MTFSSNTLPKLRRDMQIVPVQRQGRRCVALMDTLDPQKHTILDPEIVALLPLFDGQHTVRDLQLAMMRQWGGRLVLENEARRMVDELDRLLVLQTARYEAYLAEARRAFCSLGRRPPAFAGSAYPATEEALRALVDRLIHDGRKPWSTCGRVRALVAPHIDLSVGAGSYGATYAALEGQAFSRIVVLGTGHAMGDSLFAVTTKPYDTPLGAFPVDTEAVEILLRGASQAVAPDDFAHRSEHSIEFQIIFLRRLLPPDTPTVTILCGSVDEWLTKVDRLVDIPGAASFLDALRRVVDDSTLVVAGVDLSHVGPKFGDQTSAVLMEEEVRLHDQALLRAVCEGSGERLWREAQRVEDRFHVCGLSSLAVLLEVVRGARGTLVDYRIWHEQPTRSAVSFAGVVLSRATPDESTAEPPTTKPPQG